MQKILMAIIVSFYVLTLILLFLSIFYRLKYNKARQIRTLDYSFDYVENLIRLVKTIKNKNQSVMLSINRNLGNVGGADNTRALAKLQANYDALAKLQAELSSKYTDLNNQLSKLSAENEALKTQVTDANTNLENYKNRFVKISADYDLVMQQIPLVEIQAYNAVRNSMQELAVCNIANTTNIMAATLAKQARDAALLDTKTCNANLAALQAKYGVAAAPIL